MIVSDDHELVSRSETPTAREAAASEKALLEGLTNHPGWRRVVAYVQSQVAKRVAVMMTTPVKSMEQAVDDAFMRGEANGLQLVVTYVETELQAAQDTLELYRAEARNRAGVSDGS